MEWDTKQQTSKSELYKLKNITFGFIPYGKSNYLFVFNQTYAIKKICLISKEIFCCLKKKIYMYKITEK